MRTLSILLILCFSSLVNASGLFYYSPEDGRGGLRFAVVENNNKNEWLPIGDHFNFVSSDFGAWGSGKKMFDPVLLPSNDGWTIYFKTNKEGTVYGISETTDFIHWKPQEYINEKSLPENVREILKNEPVTAKIRKHKIKGRITEVKESVIGNLKNYVKQKNSLQKLYSEKTDSDSFRFKNLEKITGNLKIYNKGKEISPLLFGIFFEDINYSADGGLYAELIQNRDFEYKKGENHDKNWKSDYGWKVSGKNIHFEILEDNPISSNNPHYAHLISTHDNPTGYEDGFINHGYDGISLKKNENYRFSMMAKSPMQMPLEITLLSKDKKVIASKEIVVNQSLDWQDYEVTLKSDNNYSGAYLRISPKKKGEVDLDMISLFPVNTYNNRENGLRSDLAQTLADLKPRFIRFPGGCVAHGNGIDNIYDWKGSIGKLKDRKPLSNLWGYHQTRGLGYHEYFLFCEDIGAEPVPVLAAGVPCQNSSTPSRFTIDDLTKYGQQQGIPMDSLQSYVQDVLDLIEYANGPVASYWGSKRAEAGHSEPFNLKFIGIGNEDMITEVFKERFSIIKNAVKEAYPEITVIGTTGPFYEGSDYEEGWKFARQEKVDMVDEHYYVEPGWLIYNQDFYDNYDREGTKVYLGEWAAHLPDRSSTMETALAEALYITSLERNGDVVRMSSYAPLLAKKNHTQWRPDLIYFDNDSVYPTTDYHVMKLASENSGDYYLFNELKIDSDNKKINSRVGASVVRDSSNGATVIKLVNMLPAESELKIDLSEIMNNSTDSMRTVKVTTLKGKADDTEPEIKENSDQVMNSILKITLSPYSFTIIRI